eukprot:121335-Pelagomonas_calceolata.AAC.5
MVPTRPQVNEGNARNAAPGVNQTHSKQAFQRKALPFRACFLATANRDGPVFMGCSSFKYVALQHRKLTHTSPPHFLPACAQPCVAAQVLQHGLGLQHSVTGHLLTHPLTQSCPPSSPKTHTCMRAARHCDTASRAASLSPSCSSSSTKLSDSCEACARHHRNVEHTSDSCKACATHIRQLRSLRSTAHKNA